MTVLDLPPTGPPRSAPVVVAPDDFGRAVAAALHRLVGPVVLLGADGMDALTAVDDAVARKQRAPVVLASVRPEPLLRDRLTAWAYPRRRPFLPVDIDQPQLCVGPWVVPGRSACDRCYRRRLRQHDPAVAVTATLRRAYAENPDLRPAGWLPATAALAAALVALTLAGDPAGLQPGAVRLVNTINLIPSFGAVVGFTGCTVCDVTDPADRSWVQLSTTVRELLEVGR